jgi:hypothetical protein
MNYLEKCFKKDPNIVSRKIADEVILVPIRQNVGDLESIYTLNETSASIWELIDGKKKICQIRDKILEEFDVTPKKLEKDLAKCIRKLEEIGAIKIK